jgi:hypothetical protein
VKHAGPQTLARLADTLAALRALPGLTERKPGIFYRGNNAFVHFHEDPAGLFADIKHGADSAENAQSAERGFERLSVDTPAQRAALVVLARRRATAPTATKPANSKA